MEKTKLKTSMLEERISEMDEILALLASMINTMEKKLKK